MQMAVFTVFFGKLVEGMLARCLFSHFVCENLTVFGILFLRKKWEERKEGKEWKKGRKEKR